MRNFMLMEFPSSLSSKTIRCPPFLPFFSYPNFSGKGLPMFADERVGEAPHSLTVSMNIGFFQFSFYSYVRTLYSPFLATITTKFINFFLSMQRWVIASSLSSEWLLPGDPDGHRGGVRGVQPGEDGGEPLRDAHPGAPSRLPLRHQLIRPSALGGHP